MLAGMRRTARTRAVLDAIDRHPGSSSTHIGQRAGIKDAGQLSKLLHRLAGEGLISCRRNVQAQGRPWAWYLTDTGRLATRKAPPLRQTQPKSSGKWKLIPSSEATAERLAAEPSTTVLLSEEEAEWRRSIERSANDDPMAYLESCRISE
jgi:DNA-binding MarR family transcriptional regulator